MAAAGQCPATGGNCSTRIDTQRIWITASGADKHRLSHADLLVVGMDGQPEGQSKPSAETALHLAVYRQDRQVGAVLHGHSVAATALSRHCSESRLRIEGYEMQKAIAGIDSHEGALDLAVLDNAQNLAPLVAHIHTHWQAIHRARAFLLRGHGLYAFGRDLQEAERHYDAWEFLLQCELQGHALGLATRSSS